MQLLTNYKISIIFIRIISFFFRDLPIKSFYVIFGVLLLDTHMPPDEMSSGAVLQRHTVELVVCDKRWRILFLVFFFLRLTFQYIQHFEMNKR